MKELVGKIKGKITVQNMIILFIILQPIIDAITSLNIVYGKKAITIGIIIRTIFMVVCAVIGVIKAKKKYKIIMCIYYCVLFSYMLYFLVNSYIQNGTSLIFLQIKGLVKSFYLPIILVALIPIFEESKINIDKRILKITLMIYVIIIFISSIIGIGFPTYKTGDKAGTVGLFYSANEIGAILCLLSPFLIADFARRKLISIDIICLLLFIFAVLELGTKVPYFGLIILFVSLIFTCLINAKIKKEKFLLKKTGVFLSIIISVYLITGLTPVGENLTKIYGDVFPVTKKIFQGNTPETPQLKKFESFEELKTTTVSERNDYLKENKEKFINGDLNVKLMGIGFIENTNGEIREIKLAEMDYYDILFCNGILGSILFAIPILAFIVYFIRYTLLNKSKITIEFIYSMAMAVVVSLLAGHVLNSPAVCIYIVIILLKCNFDIRRKRGIE